MSISVPEFRFAKIQEYRTTIQFNLGQRTYIAKGGRSTTVKHHCWQSHGFTYNWNLIHINMPAWTRVLPYSGARGRSHPTVIHQFSGWRGREKRTRGYFKWTNSRVCCISKENAERHWVNFVILIIVSQPNISTCQISLWSTKPLKCLSMSVCLNAIT